MNLYDQIAAAIEKLKAEYETVRADGRLTASEAFQIFAFGIQCLVEAATQLAATGTEKKAAVMAAVGQLYDSILAPIDIPYIPEMVERTVVDPAVKKLVLIAADGLVEFFVARLSPRESPLNGAA